MKKFLFGLILLILIPSNLIAQGQPYSGGIITSTGFKVSDPQPIDDRMVVDSLSGLDVLPNQFIGLTCFVLSEDELYKKTSLGWASFASGSIQSISGVENEIIISGSPDNPIIGIDESYTDNFQNQIDFKVGLIGNEIIGGTKTFSVPIVIPDGTLSNHAVSKSQLESQVTNAFNYIYTTISVNTSTTTSWNNKIVYVDNGSNNVNIVVNDIITTAFVKLGTGSLTVTAGSGKTLYLSDGLAVCNGIKGSTFLITPDPTKANQAMVMITNR